MEKFTFELTERELKIIGQSLSIYRLFITPIYSTNKPINQGDSHNPVPLKEELDLLISDLSSNHLVYIKK
jgi:hypothetical protein